MSNKQLAESRAEVAGWPFLQAFQTEMNHLFERFNGGLGRDLQLSPAIDVAETDDAVEVTVEVPGVGKDDLDVSVANDTLIIKGEKSDLREDKDKDWRIVERRYGSFRRHVPLGFTPGDDKVDATFANGVLTLKIDKPKGAKQHTRKVEIKAR